MKRIPSSIYRLQLSEKHTLKQAMELLPYLHDLGIEGIYCSPYFAATSPHGYDIIDPNRINPQVATSKEYAEFCKRLKKLGLTHIADVVPNHMGIKGENLWWQDVLEKGKKSKYAPFFDIDWSKEKILIPFLAEPLENLLKKGELKIVRKGGKQWLKVHGELFPLAPKTFKGSLEDILKQQHYRLVPWQTATHEVSYRRFFNINELIGLRIEDPKVLKAHHKWIFELLRGKKVDGLRVDHPDGLYDPAAYFDAVRKKHKGLIVVEKILGWDEELPSNWKVDGTVGYEFLNLLTGLFVKKSDRLTQVYEQFIGKHLDFDEIVYEKKKFYMKTEMMGEVESLAKMLEGIPKEKGIKGLVELLACMPIYRTYIRPTGGVPKRDEPYLREAFHKARSKNPNLAPVFDRLEKIFFLQIDTPHYRDFILRFQQLSAPVMAKGFEDIALYNYNRLLALNEVGSSPERFGVTKEEFHTFLLRKREKWPLGLLATSTHDTKRSHDVRMQLSVLSEIPDKWEKAITKWRRLNEPHKTKVGKELFPDPNAEYFFYQILLGAWPSRPSIQRMWYSFQKSIREARAHTSWNHPNAPYEKACEEFVKAILKKESPFLKSFTQFQQEMVEFGRWNSLSAVALKLGAPGIVDIYEGCENWRYTLVDPDNRTPPKFKSPSSAKLELHRRALQFRKEHKNLFLEGNYLPLEVKGPHQEHIIAYLRSYRNETCLVAAIRYFASLKGLHDTEILLPKQMKRGGEIFTGKEYEGIAVRADQLFAEAPFAWIFWA